MAKPIGQPRRPILSQSVLRSLADLVASSAATDQTESGLLYLRRLIAFEQSDATRAKRQAQSDLVQAYKRKAKESGNG